MGCSQDKKERGSRVEPRSRVALRAEACEHRGRACHEKGLEESDEPAQLAGLCDQRRNEGGEQRQARQNLAAVPGLRPVDPGLEARCR